MSFIFFVISIATSPIYFAIWVRGTTIFCGDCEQYISNNNLLSDGKCYLQYNNTDSEFYCRGYVERSDFFYLVYDGLHEEIKLDLYTIITLGIAAPILTLIFDLIMWIKREKMIIYKLAANLFFSLVSLIMLLIVSGMCVMWLCVHRKG